MRARLLSTFGALLMVFVGASCAKGSSLSGVGGDGGSASTTTSTSTSTSSTSSSTSTSTSTSSSSTSASSSSSSGASCPESPCKLTLPQCGCDMGEACTIESYAVTCGQPGSAGFNQVCGTEKCQAGATCVTASATAAQCLQFCESDSDCQSGGICVVELVDGPGSTTSIPNVTLCTPHCDPILSTGCPSGSGCDLSRESAGQQRWYGICGPVGNKTQNQTCSTTTNNCAPGYTCLDPDGTGPASPVCLKFCDAASPLNCPGALTCYGLQDQNSQPVVLDGVAVGVCDI